LLLEGLQDENSTAIAPSGISGGYDAPNLEIYIEKDCANEEPTAVAPPGTCNQDDAPPFDIFVQGQLP